MAWHDGELFPVGKDWPNAPLMTVPCEHQHVVAHKDQFTNEPGGQQGRTCLYCFDCDESWWEDLASVKGSPWATA